MKRPQREFESEVRELFNQYSYESFGKGKITLPYFIKRDNRISTKIHVRLYDKDGNLITEEQQSKTKRAGIVFNIETISCIKPYCFIEELYLNKGYKNYGIQRETVQKIEEISKKYNCYSIQLNSVSKSARFWKKMNFGKQGDLYILNLERRTA